MNICDGDHRLVACLRGLPCNGGFLFDCLARSAVVRINSPCEGISVMAAFYSAALHDLPSGGPTYPSAAR